MRGLQTIRRRGTIAKGSTKSDLEKDEEEIKVQSGSTATWYGI